MFYLFLNFRSLNLVQWKNSGPDIPHLIIIVGRLSDDMYYDKDRVPLTVIIVDIVI